MAQKYGLPAARAGAAAAAGPRGAWRKLRWLRAHAPARTKDANKTSPRPRPLKYGLA